MRNYVRTYAEIDYRPIKNIQELHSVVTGKPCKKVLPFGEILTIREEALHAEFKARVVEYNCDGNVSGFLGKPEGKIFKFKSIDYLISGEQEFLLQLVSFKDFSMSPQSLLDHLQIKTPNGSWVPFAVRVK